jgi:hypothetical protein
MAIIKSSSDHLTINADGASKEVKIQRNGTQVLATTSTGIDVTGVTTTDGLTSSGNITFDNGNSSVSIKSDGADGSYIQFGSNEYLRFLYDNGASESIRLLDGGGITFNGNTAAANALNDYEEGEHIVSITSASGSITEHSSYNTLRYTKIGDTVTVSGRVDVSSVSSPSGVLTISLPFATPSGTKSHSAVTLFIWAATASETGLWIGWLEGGSSVMYLRYGNSGTPVSNVSGYIQAGTEFRINVTYKTA